MSYRTHQDYHMISENIEHVHKSNGPILLYIYGAFVSFFKA